MHDCLDAWLLPDPLLLLLLGVQHGLAMLRLGERGHHRDAGRSNCCVAHRLGRIVAIVSGLRLARHGAWLRLRCSC
jgi:hypothetical protein